MDDVLRWLQSVGLAQYAPDFAEHGISLSDLPELSEADLRELGLPIGARKQLRRALRTRGARSGAERRPLSVLFLDLVGSSRLAELLEPEDLMRIMQRYREACAGPVARYDGRIAQFLGDGVLAYFGFPAAHEDDPERAVRAALEAVEAVRRLRVPLPNLPPGQEPLRARAGIATGQVVIGDLLGHGDAPGDSMAIGSTPNLAARLQALAPPGGVIVSGETRARLTPIFEMRDLGPQVLKGFSEPCPAFLVRREAQRSGQRRRLARPDAFVNRLADLARLQQAWESVLAGASRTVLLRGEAGIGKSSLLRRFLATRRDRIGSATLTFIASPFHTDTPFHPLVTPLRTLARLAPDEEWPDALVKLRHWLGDEAPEIDERAAALAELLLVGDDGAGARPAALSAMAPRRLRSLTLTALLDQLTRLSARQPLCLMVEDLHWLDPSSMELLERALSRLPGRCLLLLTSREAFTPPATPAWGDVELLELRPLSEPDMVQLVEAVAGSSADAPHLTRRISRLVASRTEGVPLYAQELARAILDGTVEAEAEVPPSLRECLVARLDRAQSAKAVAQAAAVAGRSVPRDLLQAVTELPKEELDAALAHLELAGVLQRRSLPGREGWTFHHALLRDAAYESLVRDRRRLLHARLAQALPRLDPDRVTAEPEVLAHHLAEAGRVADSVPLWLAATRRSLARSAYPEATRLLRRALRAIDTVPPTPALRAQRLELLALLGPALIALHGPGAAETQDHYAESYAALNDTPAEESAHFPIAWGWWRVSRDYNIKRLRSGALTERAARRGEPGSLLQAHHCGWGTRFGLGDLCGCRRDIESGLAIYEAGDYRHHATLYGNHDAKVCALGETALLEWLEGRPEAALRAETRAQAWALEIDHLGSILHALDIHAMHRAYRRDPAEMAEAARRMMEAAETHDLPDYRAKGMIFGGWAASARGDAAEGLRSIEAGLAVQREVGTIEDFPIFHTLLAEAQTTAGQVQRAVAELDEARELFERVGLHIWMPEVWRVLGLLRLQAGGPGSEAAAEASLREALRLAEAQGAWMLVLRTRLSLANLDLRLGRLGDAEMLQRLAGLAERAEREGDGEVERLLAALRRTSISFAP
ncbi:AAA family ATPase [Roseomonas gilardii]|uniref:AAA family ATPase n=1 Tax=Roseomonas gilardii TaxID=257708 RepID=A0ABU3MCT3_9PROT|nr:AAA family ATPase [Roseomonas gilardii]MDT8330728.1 AAA family ATPase [Roseomonas gilardii]